MRIKAEETLNVVLGSSGSGKTWYAKQQLLENSRLRNCVVVTGLDHSLEYHHIVHQNRNNVKHYVVGKNMTIYDVLKIIDYSTIDFVVIEDISVTKEDAQWLGTILSVRFKSVGILVMQDYKKDYSKVV